MIEDVDRPPAALPYAYSIRALSVSVLLLEPSGHNRNCQCAASRCVSARRCREDAAVAGRAAPAGLARAHPVGHVSRELVAYLTTTVPPGL
jgi:hypothetical protein